MITRVGTVGGALFVAFGLFSRAALADASPGELAMARQLFSDAVVLENEGEWERASAKLRDALAIKETPGLRFHLAHCEEESGRLVEALLDYDRAGELLRTGAKAHDVEMLLEPARQALIPRIPTLTVNVPDVPGVSVEVDKMRLGASAVGRPEPLNPTRHQLIVRAPGRSSFERAFALAEGQALVLSAELPLESEPGSPPAARAPASPTPARDASAALSASSPGAGASTRDQPSSSKPWVLAGESLVGLASLGVGIGFYVSRLHAVDRLEVAQNKIDAAATENGIPSERFCSSSPEFGPCLDDAQASRDASRALVGAVAGFAGAGIAAGVLVVTALAWPSSSNTRALVPTLRIGEGGGFAGVSARF